MKSLSQFITEKLKIQKNIDKTKTNHILFPESIKELHNMILDEIKKNGNGCSLNHIDVSKITDMSYLFFNIDKFNGDISEWDVSSVTDMRNMFRYSQFNGDISEWDVSNVTNMNSMFTDCSFNGDISGWDVSNVEDVAYMFYKNDVFNKDISKWDLKSVKDSKDIFGSSPLQNKKEFWPKALQ